MSISNRLIKVLKIILYLIGFYNFFYLSTFANFVWPYVIVYLSFHYILGKYLQKNGSAQFETIRIISTNIFYILPIIIYFSMENTDKSIYDFLFSANFYKNIYTIIKSMF
ncbi:hypothetical protein C0Z22_10380 [Halobacteriovorax sp. DA5]|nr:hypothetical protein C0Z22_10380 [Halobacteriovorax sp. DA5]